MHSHWPPVLSTVAILLAWPVVLARTLTASPGADRQLAAVIGFGLLNCTLREPNVQTLIRTLTGGGVSVVLVHQLAVVAAAASSASAVPLARAMRGLPPRPVLLAVTTVAWVASAAVLSVAADPAAAVEGRDTGWVAALYLGGAVPLLVLAGHELVALGVSGVRGAADGLEVALHVMAAAVGSVNLVLAAVRILTLASWGTGWADSFVVAHRLIGADLFLPAVLAGVVFYAVAPARAFLERAGLDTWSRTQRQLRPLWTELTEVCPEIVHHANEFGRRDARYRVHRYVVEIRDCMVILARYGASDGRAVEIDREVPADARAALVSAVGLARAARARAAGASPSTAAVPVRATARDMTSEIEDLTELAALWPRARAIVASETDGGGYSTGQSDTRGTTWFGNAVRKSRKRPTSATSSPSAARPAGSCWSWAWSGSSSRRH